VLVCGLHLGERVEARDDTQAEPAAQAAAHADPCGEGHDEPGNAAHTCHHHCPNATDPRPIALAAPQDPAHPLHGALPIAALDSLRRAPPVEPPSL